MESMTQDVDMSQSGMMQSTQRSYQQTRLSRAQPKDQLWKINNRKAQKNGTHRTIYWVKHKEKYEDGSVKGEKWMTSVRYVGDWKMNKKSGFGVQVYPNGDKYEGGWKKNKRNGQGTLWVKDKKKKLKRKYTGDWINDKKFGRGTMFFDNDDRYDGFWENDLPHGDGRMIYANGDVYEGQWYLGKRNGYGVLTKRNGDHFEGKWVNDKREGQGSYFYSSKNKVFVGEWVNDQPKAGVYSEVEDPDKPPKKLVAEFTDEYELPPIPKIKLENPTDVLHVAMEKSRDQRVHYRAKHIPMEDLFTQEELEDLQNQFSVAANEGQTITMVYLMAILEQMNFEKEDEEIEGCLKQIDGNVDFQAIVFEQFARLIAILLEELNKEVTQEDYVAEEGELESGEYLDEEDEYQDDDEDGEYLEGEYDENGELIESSGYM